MVADPFRITAIPAPLRWPIEAALGISTLRALYGRVQQTEQDSGEPFERRALRVLDIMPHATESDLSSIAASGPVVIAANHPHGAVDGLVLLDLVRRVRPDVRV